MEFWWFLKPLFETSLIIALIGNVIALFILFIDKITDETGFVAPFIVVVSAIPCAISLIFFFLNVLSSMLYNIWSPFL